MDPRLQARLSALRGKIRRLFAENGLSWIALVVFTAVLVSVTLDWWLRLPAPIRLILLIGGLGAAGYVAWCYLISPLAIPLGEDDMALVVERRYPDLGDRLISAAQLARQIDGAEAAGVSRAMIDAVNREAAEMAQNLDFETVLQSRGVHTRAGMALGLGLVFLLLCGFPGFISTGLVRYLNPFTPAEWPYRTRLKITAAKKVARGDNVRISATASGEIPSRAFIRYRYGDAGSWESEPMTRFGRDRFEIEFKSVAAHFAYRIEAGDNLTRERRVTVVDRPALEKVALRYTYPAYTGREPKTFVGGHGNVRAVRGTRVRLSAAANKTLEEAYVTVGDGIRQPIPIDAAGQGFSLALPTDASTIYTLEMIGEDGFANGDSYRYEIRILPDRPPTVKVLDPARDLDLTPGGRFTLEAEAKDDIAVQRVGARYRIVGKGAAAAAGEIPFEIPRRDDKHVRTSYLWDISEYAVKPGQTLLYHVEAADSRDIDGGPGVGRSLTFRLRIVSRAEMAAKFDQRKLALRDALKRIIKLQDEDKTLVDDLRELLAGTDRFDLADRQRAKQAESQQRSITARTRDLARRVARLLRDIDNNKLLTRDDEEHLQLMTSVLTEQHTVKMPDAAARILTAATARDAAARTGALTGASDRQAEILGDLRALLENLRKWEQTEELLRLARQLLKKQHAITAQGHEYALSGRIPRGFPARSLQKKARGLLRDLAARQRGAAADMKNLQDKMLDTLTRVQRVDAFLAAKVRKALRVARNVDVSLTASDEAGAPSDSAHWSGVDGDEVAPSVEGQMRAAAANVRQNRLGIARAHQLQTKKGLQRIIGVLSARRDIDHEKLERRIRALRRKLRRLIARQRANQQKTRDLARQQQTQRQLDEAQRELERLIARQRALRGETAQIDRPDERVADMERRFEAARRELSRLIAAQRKTLQENEQSQSGLEKAVARVLERIVRLERAQADLARRTDQARGEFHRAVAAALEKTRKLRRQQAGLKARIDQASAASGAQGQAEARALETGQAMLPAIAESIAKKLRQAAQAGRQRGEPPAPAIARAEQAAQAAQVAASKMRDTARKLGAGKGGEAASRAQVALERLDQMERLLAGLVGELDQGARRRLEALAEPQKKLAQTARALAGEVGKIGDPAAEASRALTSAAGQMNQAREKLGQGESVRARARQTEALREIVRAREALAALAGGGGLAKSRAAKTARLAAQQGDVAERTGALRGQISDLERALARLENDGNGPAAGAQGAGRPGGSERAQDRSPVAPLGQAGRQMAQAKRQLDEGRPAPATGPQKEAVLSLEEARRRLTELGWRITEKKDVAKRLARRQLKLRQKVRQLGEKVAELGKQAEHDGGRKNLADAGRSMERARQHLNQASQQGSGQRPGSPQGGGQQGGQQGGGQQGGGQQGDRQSPQEAVAEQDKALEALEKAAQRLAELAKKLQGGAKQPAGAEQTRKLAQDQDSIRRATDRLTREITDINEKLPSKNAQSAKSKTKSASRHMSQASSQQSRGQPGQADDDQEQAASDLEQADRDLAALEDEAARRRQQDELFRIESELKAMLDTQKNINTVTADVEHDRSQRPDRTLSRVDRNHLHQATTTQGLLLERTQKVVRMLKEAPVFQFVLRGARDDMGEVQRLLERQKTGDYAQEIEQDIADKLKKLIEALKKERKKRQQQAGGGGGGGGGGRPPLVPPLAELKMIRTLQGDVNAKTRKLDDSLRAGGRRPTDEQKARIGRLARKQGEVAEITQRLSDQLTGKTPDAEEGP